MVFIQKEVTVIFYPFTLYELHQLQKRVHCKYPLSHSSQRGYLYLLKFSVAYGLLFSCVFCCMDKAVDIETPLNIKLLFQLQQDTLITIKYLLMKLI